MDFEWDERKAATSRRKHGVDFEIAARVFLDPHRIESYDNRGYYAEDRWITVGMVDPVVLVVVYTVRGEEDQVIARKANEKERRQYHQVCA